MDGDEYDVFFSYARDDLERARPLFEALAAAGVRVWRDEERLETFAHIQHGIRAGLARSRLLLAFFSHTYPKRRACDWELAAVLTTGRADCVLVVNPEDGNTHITPKTLREGLYAGPDEDIAALVARIKVLAKEARGVLGDPLEPPPDQAWVGLRQGAAPARFVGRRRQIWQVHDGLMGKGSVLLAPSTSGLGPGNGAAHVRGLGGVGKTLLAEEYAHRFAAAYPGGIFRLRAGGGQAGTAVDVEARRLEQLGAVARGLSLPMQEAARDPVALEGLVRQALSGRATPYLWLVDDLPHGLTAEQVQAWCAPTTGGRTLMTTRDTGLDSLAEAVDLDVLTPEEAHILLTSFHTPKTEKEDQAARDICALLGHHALAVEVTARLVRQQGYAWVSNALRNPAGDALELAAQLRFELPTGHDKSIAATLLLSINALAPAALDVLRLASVFAWNQPIPVHLLAAVLAFAEGRDPVPDDEAAAILAVDEAASHSLCEAEDGVFTVHGLVCRTLTLHKAGDRTDALRTAALEALRRRMSKAGDIRNHRDLLPLLPHAQTMAAEPQTAAEADLTGWVGRFLNEAGSYAAAERAWKAALSAERRILGVEHPDTLTSMNNLASTLWAQGDRVGAQALQEQVLELRRRVSGAEHPDTLTSMNNLASTLWALGDHAGARAREEQILAVRRRVLGEEHPDTLTSMNNLATTLWALGEHVGAQALQEQVLAVRRRVSGEEHPDTLRGMNNLATMLRARGDHVGARPLQEQVLEVRRRVLGEEHPDTLVSMNNLASTLWAQGDHAGAWALQEQALEVQRSVLGAEHPATLTSMNNLATILWAQGDHGGSSALLEQVLEMQGRVLGEEHPDTLSSMHNLAPILWAQGDHAGARALLESALEARRRVSGAEHPKTLKVQGVLAVTMAAQGEAAAALPLIEQSVAGLTAKLGPGHPDVQETIKMRTFIQQQADEGT